MHHELFGDIEYRRADEFWTGKVCLRRFAAFGGKPYDDEAMRRRRREGMLPLVIYDPTGRGPSPRQEAAYRFLRDNEDDVLRAALGALFESYTEYSASPMSGLWGWVGRWLGVSPITSTAGLAVAARFDGVEIAREYHRDLAYLIFNVHCDWEPEHGMMVIYHKDQPATWTTADGLDLESDGPDE
jgi:Domain of unknown function (DUF6985)